jgi:hypothetical protein
MGMLLLAFGPGEIRIPLEREDRTAMLLIIIILARQKKSWVESGSGSLPSE